MTSETSQLRTLLKHADTLQDLRYDHQELERKKKAAIDTDFAVKKSIAEYQYFKGLEAKSFVVFQIVVALFTGLLFFLFFDFFDRQILALVTALVLGTGINIWFVLGYQPYKVEDWYMIGLIFYGLLLAGFGTILFAYLSVVFFLDTGDYLLMMLALLNVHLIVSLIVGAIFPVTFGILDHRAIKNPLLTASLEELEKDREKAVEEMSQELASIEKKIQKVEKELAAITVIPDAYKATKTIKTLMQYFEEKRVHQIDQAIALYDLEEKDALRRMRMI